MTGTDLAGLPLSKYAFEGKSGDLRFFEIVERKSGARYVNELKGSPGDFRRVNVAGHIRAYVRDMIRRDPKPAVLRFSKEFTCCSRCLAPLTDALSREVGMGPDCRKQLGY